MALEDVLARCIEKWRGEGIVLAPPVEEAEVHLAWERFGKQVSEDVVRFYSTVGGFAEYECDHVFLWSLWPWGMLRQENTDRRGEGVMFCDHSIQVFTWELRFENDARSSVWEIGSLHTDPQITAPSLESFFRLYLKDLWLLHPGSPSDGRACKQQGPRRGAPVAGKSDPPWDAALDG